MAHPACYILFAHKPFSEYIYINDEKLGNLAHKIQGIEIHLVRHRGECLLRYVAVPDINLRVFILIIVTQIIQPDMK